MGRTMLWTILPFVIVGVLAGMWLGKRARDQAAGGSAMPPGGAAVDAALK